MTQIAYETIPIHENNDPLVDLATYPFVIQPMYFEEGVSKDPVIRARKEVADKLLTIQNSFHGKYRFKIWDAHRPREVQDAIYVAFRSKLVKDHPELTDQELDAKTQLFVTKASDPNRIPPHATGGTVDLTLVDEAGTELDMGTAFDHFGPEAMPWFFEDNDTNVQARANRHILIDTMTDAGFTVHDDEWWHFDYGNQVWAVKKSEPFAVYSEAFLDASS